MLIVPLTLGFLLGNTGLRFGITGGPLSLAAGVDLVAARATVAGGFLVGVKSKQSKADGAAVEEDVVLERVESLLAEEQDAEDWYEIADWSRPLEEIARESW